jgi:hypothetical protein
MKGYRFYPLDGFPNQGLLVSSKIGKPKPAEFLTLKQARATAKRKSAA